MNIDPDVKLHYVDFLVLQALERIETKLHHLMEKQTQMVVQLDNLVAEVAKISSTVDSAIVLIQSIAAELKRIQTEMVDPALLQPLIDKLTSEDTLLAQAVVANTPAQTTFTITDTEVGTGTVSFDTPGPYASGTVVTLTATPGDGFAFSDWSGDLVSVENPAHLVMDGNKTITATFTAL